MKNKLYIICILFYMNVSIVPAQLSLDWIRTFGDSINPAAGYNLIDDNIGHIYIEGRITGANYLWKYDYYGNLIWSVTCPYDFTSTSGITIDEHTHICLYGEAPVQGNVTGGCIMLYDSSGAFQWVKTYLYPSTNFTIFEQAVFNFNHEIVVYGYNFIGSNENHFLATYDLTGNFLRINDCLFNNAIMNSYGKICLDHSGNIILAGNTGANKIMLIKYGLNDTIIWQTLYNSNSFLTGHFRDFAVDKGNNIYFCAEATPPLNVDQYALIAKFDSSGNLLHDDYYHDSAYSSCYPGNLIIFNDTSVIYSATAFNSNSVSISKALWREYDSTLTLKYSYKEDSILTGSSNYNLTVPTLFSDSMGQLYLMNATALQHNELYMQKFSVNRNKLWTQLLPDTMLDLNTQGAIMKGEDNFYFTGLRIDCVTLHYQNQSILSVQKVKKNSVELYPNPSGNKLHFTVDNPECKLADIMVFDIQGKQLIKSTQKYCETGYLDISDLHSGIYLLKIFIGDKEYISKFIKME